MRRCLAIWFFLSCFLALMVGEPESVCGDDPDQSVHLKDPAADDSFDAGQAIDLFLFAGQSNMVGADADPAELPESSLDQRVWFWWATGDPPADVHDSTSQGRWQTLGVQPKGNPLPRDGANRQWGNYTSDEGGFGPEIGFARKRLASLQVANGSRSKVFAILKVAYSGTSLERDWDPTQKDSPGNCYGELIRQWQAATMRANEEGFKLRPAGFFWVQGESDIAPGRVVHYADRLRRLLKAVRELTVTPKLPAFLALNTRFLGPDNPGVLKVIQAQQGVAESDPHCVYVDTSRATIANRVHFDAQGTLMVGRLFADAWQQSNPAAGQPK